MRKGLVLVLVVSVLLVSLVVRAEEQARVYSGFERFVDNIRMFFSGEDGKVRLALEIREKEVDSAIVNMRNQGEDEAIKNLERARKKLQVVQEKVSLDTSGEIKVSVEEVKDKINEEDSLTDEFDDYLLEEEKTGLTAELTEKTFEYCSEIAKEDFALMLNDEECNPETAIPGLEKDLKALKKLQEESFIRLMLEIRSCINDPGTCNCEASLDDDERAKCERMVALAVKCEYKDDETSCGELEAMMPSPGDGFARSFIPDYLEGSFDERRDLIEYGLEHSDGVPKECWNENDKPECDKYDSIKEDGLDWDEEGNWIGWERGKIRATHGVEETLPTIKEAFPECYNEEGMFLSECGNINVVWSEDGSVNYIIDKQIDGVIDDFENRSMQRMIDANGTMGLMGDENWTIDEGEWTVSNKVREIKRDMNQITNQIKDIVYAPGTVPGGVGGVVVDGDDVVMDGDGGGNVVDNVVAGDGVDDGVVADDMSVDAGPITDDSVGDGVDDGVDPGPDGIVGVIDDDGDSGDSDVVDD